MLYVAHIHFKTSSLPLGVGNIPVGLQPMSSGSSHGRSPDSIAPGSSLPSYSAPSLGNGASVSPSGDGGKVNVHLVLSPGGGNPSGPGQGKLKKRLFIFNV